MITSIVKIIAGLFDIPRWIQEVRGFFLKRKVQKLEVAVAQKDATMASERVAETVANEAKEEQKVIKDESSKKDLDDIADYFGSN